MQTFDDAFGHQICMFGPGTKPTKQKGCLFMARIVGIQHIVQHRTYLWAHFLVHRLNQEKLPTHPSQHCQWSQNIRNAAWANNNAVLQYNTAKTCRLSSLSLKESRHLEYGWSMPKAVYIYITSFKINDMPYDNSQVVTDHQTTILHWPLLHLLDGMQAVRGSSQNPMKKKSEHLSKLKKLSFFSTV